MGWTWGEGMAWVGIPWGAGICPAASGKWPAFAAGWGFFPLILPPFSVADVGRRGRKDSPRKTISYTHRPHVRMETVLFISDLSHGLWSGVLSAWSRDAKRRATVLGRDTCLSDPDISRCTHCSGVPPARQQLESRHQSLSKGVSPCLPVLCVGFLLGFLLARRGSLRGKLRMAVAMQHGVWKVGLGMASLLPMPVSTALRRRMPGGRRGWPPPRGGCSCHPPSVLTAPHIHCCKKSGL